MRSIEYISQNRFEVDELVNPQLPDIQLALIQIEILELLSSGFSQTEIAEQKGIPREKLKYFINKPEGRCKPLFQTLEVHSDTAAVGASYRLGILEPDPTLDFGFLDELTKTEHTAFDVTTTMQAYGYTITDAAEVLGMSESTLKKHWTEIYAKSPIKNACEAIKYRVGLAAYENSIDEE